MGMLSAYQVIFALLILMLLSYKVTKCSAEVVFINDDETLGKYLCPPSGTISPNTSMVLNQSTLTIRGKQFCHIQNTSNITIAPSQDFSIIQCSDGSGGFGFFNVTNLTIESISFSGCENVIPAPAVRYINESNHFMYYNATETILILNHCYNVKLYGLLFESTNLNVFSIIGINLCGLNEIGELLTSKLSISIATLNLLFYYTDSDITSVDSECALYIEFDAYPCCKSMPPSVGNVFGDKPNRISVPQVACSNANTAKVRCNY